MGYRIHGRTFLLRKTNPIYYGYPVSGIRRPYSVEADSVGKSENNRAISKKNGPDYRRGPNPQDTPISYLYPTRIDLAILFASAVLMRNLPTRLRTRRNIYNARNIIRTPGEDKNAI